MAKIIRLSDDHSEKLGLKKARRKKKTDLEDFGQLNMFAQKDPKIIPFNSPKNVFDRALESDEKGEDEQAEQYYWQAIQHGEAKDDAYCNLGILKSSQGALSESADLFSKALQENPRHLESHFNLGNVYADLGNNKLARFHYETALLINQEFTDCYYNLALLDIEEKSYDKAVRLLLRYQQLLSFPDKQVDAFIEDLKQYL